MIELQSKNKKRKEKRQAKGLDGDEEEDGEIVND